MSLIPTRILFTPPNQKYIGIIAVDAAIRETYTRKSKLTDYPIEDGSSISDHIINYPKTIELEGMMGCGDKLSVYNLQNVGDSFADVFYAINYLMDAKLPVPIVMGLATYTDMVIESFVVNRDKQTSKGLPFTLSAKEAVVVKSQILTVPNSQVSGTQAEGALNYGTTNSGAGIGAFQAGASDAANNAQIYLSTYGKI